MFMPHFPRHAKWQLLLLLLQEAPRLKKYAGLAMEKIHDARQMAYRVGQEHQRKFFAESGSNN